jgi:hypothetical protein
MAKRIKYLEYLIFTLIKLMISLFTMQKSQIGGICTATMQHNEGSNLQQVHRTADKKREKIKDIDKLPTENAKKEPPPRRN